MGRLHDRGELSLFSQMPSGEPFLGRDLPDDLRIGEGGFRVTIEPGPETGLLVRSQAMADKPVTIRRERIGQRIGQLGPADMARLNAAQNRPRSCKRPRLLGGGELRPLPGQFGDPLPRVEVGPIDERKIGDLTRVIGTIRNVDLLAVDMNRADPALVLQ